MKEWFLLLILIILSVSAAIQAFYYIYFYLSVYFYKAPARSREPEPVSVIICARNEADNLRQLLPSVLSQDYPDYEVIVVNDCSDDDTYDVLGTFLKQHSNLRISTIFKDPKFTHNKKLAQLVGIKAAKNEILLFTDADCKPVSDKWIREMTGHFNDGTSFVLGYGGYQRESSLLNAWIRTDTANIAMQYLGMAIRGIPYMGVGRNLAYRRSEFFRANGFGIHSNLASGDDDLFINNNALKTNTSVEFSPEAHTRSVPSSSIREWLIQKRRHLTTAPFYKERDKVILAAEPVSRIIFYATFIILLASGHRWIIILPVFGFRLAVQATVLSLAQKRLAEKGILGWSLIFDIFSPIVNAILYIGNSARSHRRAQWS